jgi:hypothetical protein
MKPTLIASGSKRLKLEHVKLLSTFAFKFKLRRYHLVAPFLHLMLSDSRFFGGSQLPLWATKPRTPDGMMFATAAGVYTQPLLSSNLAISVTVSP